MSNMYLADIIGKFTIFLTVATVFFFIGAVIVGGGGDSVKSVLFRNIMRSVFVLTVVVILLPSEKTILGYYQCKELK